MDLTNYLEQLYSVNGRPYYGVIFFFETPFPFNEGNLKGSRQGDLYITIGQMNFKSLYLIQVVDNQCAIWIKSLANNRKCRLISSSVARNIGEKQKDVLVFKFEELISKMYKGSFELVACTKSS